MKWMKMRTEKQTQMPNVRGGDSELFDANIILWLHFYDNNFLSLKNTQNKITQQTISVIHYGKKEKDYCSASTQ